MHLNKYAIFRYILIGFIIIFALACGAYYSIPLFLEKKLLTMIAKSYGFTESSCEVRKLSLNKLDIASLKLGHPENPAIEIDSVRVDYSLSGLFKKYVNKVVINGLQIRGEHRNGNILIPPIDLRNSFKSSSDAEQKKEDNSSQYMLPINFGEFEIKNSTIILQSGDTNFIIPFSIKAKYISENENGASSVYDLLLKLHPDSTNLFPGLEISSQIDMHANFDLKSNDFRLQLNLSDMNIEYNGYKIQNSPGNVPLTVEISKIQNVFHIYFSSFCIMSPFPVEIHMERNAGCTLRVSREGIDIKGKFYVNLNKEVVNSNSSILLKLTNSTSLPINLKGRKTGNNWYFSLNYSGTHQPLQFCRQTDKFYFYPDRFAIYGKGKGATGAVKFVVKASHIKYDSDYIQIEIPDFWIYGNSRICGTEYPTVKALVKLADMKFNAGDLCASEICAKIPFQWPYPSTDAKEFEFKNKKTRYLNIDKLKYSDMDLGTISATPHQDGMNIVFSGQYSDLLPDLRINFSVLAGVNEEHNFISKADFKASEPDKVIKFDLEKFSPQLTGMSFEGNLDIRGNFSLIGSAIKSNCFITMHNSRIDCPEKKMVFEGIDLNLNIPDLYNFHSDPKQVLKFKRFVWGTVEMNDVEMEFRINSSSSLFLEKCGFSWCGGHVYTHGLRLDAAENSIDLTLYCDRLKLATILKQFNAANADGEGAVNGRIPVSYKGGRINIYDGFLYSTPGEGGTISIDTDTLAPGMSNIQQSIQMQIASEALKNFSYDWAKLSLQSHGDDLVINMKMDGRPADLLPFSFKKNIGLYKAEGQPKAHFQGILFDINFKLPLEKMLHYGAGISDLMQNE